MFQVRAFRPAPLASAAVTNFTQLQTLILSSSTTTTTTRFSCFPALECAIERYQMLFGDGAFYNRLLPLIVDWAAVTAPAGCTTTSAAGDVLLELDPLVFDSESPPPPPPPDSDSSPLLFREKSVSLSCDQARFILANCFLGNNPHTPATTGHLDYSALDLLRLFSCKATEDSIAAERILCLLSYFHSSTTSAAAARSITFTRRQLTSSSSSSTTTSTSINAFYSNLPLLTQISLFPGSMEDSSSESFVDFANQRIHIFSIIDSATQEEVLFSCCPEAYIAMGLFPTMQDNEAILISGVVRTATYSGYAHTFQFKGLYPGKEFDLP